MEHVSNVPFEGNMLPVCPGEACDLPSGARERAPQPGGVAGNSSAQGNDFDTQILHACNFEA